MTQLTNAFWREVIDHLPGIFLLFRIDEKEEAHLIFTNGNIRSALGFTPEEFVLASESADTPVAAGIAELINGIATLSHGSKNGFDGDNDNIGTGAGDTRSNAQIGNAKQLCRFYSKRAVEYSFYFEYQIFSSKNSVHPFIAVSLRRASEGSVDAVVDKNRAIGTPPFIAESALMKAVINKLDIVTNRREHLLFRGESGTGKRTIARQILQSEALSGIQCIEWNLNEFTPTDQDEAVERLCGGNSGEIKNAEASDKLTLLIINFSKFSISNQKKMFDWLKERAQNGNQTRILATSGIHLEEQINEGRISPELYYFLGFDSILMPPLSQRKEDIKYLIDFWICDVADYLGMCRLTIEEQVIDDLLQHNWPGNFHEFFRVMRRSLLASEHGKFQLKLDPEAVTVVSKSESIAKGKDFDLQEIVMFDEMNRRYLSKVLQETKGVIYGRDGAANLLGMKPTTLQSKLKKLGLR